MRHRFDRALRILQFVQSGEAYDPLSLAVALRVHRRTVYRDISTLRELGIDIGFDDAFGGYVIQGASRFGGSPFGALGDALRSAMSDDQHGSSVQAIIQYVAAHLEESDQSRDGVVSSGNTLFSSCA
ncbi:MAG: HTH domain-containing protein, partial [Planctomycetota bacterium]